MGKFIGRKVPVFLLAVLMAANLLVASAMAIGTTVKAYAPEGRVKISATDYAIVDGVKETKLTTNNTAGNNQHIGYIVDIDTNDYANGNIQIAAGYMNYSTNAWGLQSVTDQATQYERQHNGYKVVAAINADFFNMNTGEPSGALVMDGKVGHTADYRPYFAILKDGSAVIREGDVNLPSDVVQAVGGNYILVKDGKNNVTTDEAYAVATVSRTAIGIREDGSVVMYVTHGSTPPTSCGETYSDIADVLVAQGCVIGLNLDGGGSATLATVREGASKLVVQNSPSDGVPRTVSSTLFVVSTIQSDGVFDHASLTPNNEYYTPSLASTKTDIFSAIAAFFGLADNAVYTTVQFEAQGVDKSGASAELPASGLTWRLAADSKDKGTIDPKTGLFTAAVGALGEVNVELCHNNAVVGSTSIQLMEPDTVYFESVALSLDFSQVSDLGLTVRGQGVDLNTKDGDFTWEMKNTKNNEPLGFIENNLFTAHAKMDDSLEGTITVTYNGNSELTASIDVEIGKMPVIALDFEDPDYKAGIYDWGAAGSFFQDGQPAVYKTKTGDGIFYHLRRQTWNGSGWTNPSDSYWVHEVTTSTCPWTAIDGDDVNVTMNAGYDHGYNQFGYTTDAVYETGVKLDTYGQNGQIWVVSGPAAGKDTATLEVGAERYSWFVYTDGVTFTGNYNAAIPASGVLSADGYGIYAYHAAAIATTSHNEEDLHGYGGGVVTKENGQVRFGNQALKLTYDFRTFVPSGSTKNANINYRVTEALVAPGNPTGFGMWFYAPEDMSNFWLWCEIAYWNGSVYKNQTVHFTPAGAEKSCQYTGINWTGWKYVEANLDIIYNAGAQVDAEHPIMIRPGGQGMIMMTYIPGGTNDGNGNAIVCGSKSTGEFYVDNVRWVYGTNVDDMDYPEILSVTAGSTELSTEESVTVDNNNVSFDIRYTDPLGENYSGIDSDGTQLFLDGSPLTPGKDFDANTDHAQTVETTLANGEHTLRVSITDNFGNVTDKTYYFVVSNPDGDLPTVIIDREVDAELGGDYNITISVGNVQDWEKITSVSTNITYKNTAKLETERKITSGDVNIFYDDYLEPVTQTDGGWIDSQGQLITDSNELMKPGASPEGGFAVSSAVQKLGSNLTGLVRNRKADDNTRVFYVNNATVNEDIKNSDLTILSFTLPVPSNLKENDYVPYNVTVTITTVDGETYYLNTGDLKANLWAYYEIEPEVLVQNRENGTIAVNPTMEDVVFTSEGVELYDGTQKMDGSFTGNSFNTSYFHGKTAGNNYNIQVRNDAERHYSFVTPVNVVEWSGEKDGRKAYDVTLNPSLDNNTTAQNITWLSSLEGSGEALVQYMTAEAYDAAYESSDDAVAAENAAFEGVKQSTGTSVLYSFELGFTGAFINRVELNGLEPGTEYVCRVGDGSSEGWSVPVRFSTYEDDGTTSFVVVGDAQLHGNGNAEDLEAIETLMNIGANVSGFDFGVQTGDYVDGGTNFAQWSQILGVWQDAFSGIDFVKAMGNHETNNLNGSNISAAIYGLESSNALYYSVEYGNVYVAVINQHANLIDAAAWLVDDAAKSDATWKVLVEHQPPYYTNPLGSSDGHHNLLAPACDEAGIDFVFSGHDHSYARTEQIYAETALDMTLDGDHYVDAKGSLAATKGKGTVYIISGDLGEKSRENSYRVQNPNNYPFAKTAQDYDSLYVTVEADDYSFTVTAWNMHDSGVAEVWDTFTMYNGAGVCLELGEHDIPDDGTAKYDPATGKLVCGRCGEQIAPADMLFSGFAENVNGPDEYGDYQYYFLAGKLQKGTYSGTDGKHWIPYGDIFLYANDEGLLDHTVENWGDETCTKDGKNRAYSPRYDASYASGASQFTGHHYVEQEDGSLVCDNVHKDEKGNEYVCGHVAIDVADWDIYLGYKSVTYTGALRTVKVHIVDPETGDELEFHTDGTGSVMTDYRRLWSNNRYVGTASVEVSFPMDGDDPIGDYYNSNGPITLYMDIRPDLPTELTATAKDDGSVTLTWKHALAKKSVGCDLVYEVYYSDDGKTWNLAGTTADNSYEFENVNSGVGYRFRIRSCGTVDGKEYTSIGYTPLVSVDGGIALNDEYTITRTWTKTTYSGSAREYSENSLKVVAPDGTVLVKDTDYTVTYENNVNVGTATGTITGIGYYTGTLEFTFAIRPVAPLDVAAENVTITSARVTFTRNDASLGDNAADKYYVYVDGEYVGCTEDDNYYDINGLRPDTTYTITVVAVKEIDGVSYKSAPGEVTITTDFLGDLNENDIIDAGDATMILRAVVNVIDLPEEKMAFADVNKNGTIDTGDATLVLRAVVA